jgi:hypothetical protein
VTAEQQRDALWTLLDDIDTLDDACKGDDAAFRKRCYELQQRRHGIVDGAYVDSATSAFMETGP